MREDETVSQSQPGYDGGRAASAGSELSAAVLIPRLREAVQEMANGRPINGGDFEAIEDLLDVAEAAPNLLEALQRLAIQMNNLLLVAEVPERFAASFNDAQRQAADAIAKATGAGS